MKLSWKSWSRKVVNDSSVTEKVVGGEEWVRKSCWENMPAELLREICKRVEEDEHRWPFRKNVVACAGVCTTWRQAIKDVVSTPHLSGRLTFPISLKQPGPRNCLLQCYIKRNCSTHTFHLCLNLSLALADDGKFLLAARRFRRPTYTDYIISLHSNDIFKGNSCYVGKLRSNFLGTKFDVYDAKPPHTEARTVRSSSIRLPGSSQISSRVPGGNYPVAHVSYELNMRTTSEDTISISEGNAEEQFFSVEDKLLFSLSSISISPDELRCVSIDENMAATEFPIRRVHDYESEGETMSTRSSISDSEEKREKLKGLIKKLKKGQIQNTFNKTLPTINSFGKSFIKNSRRHERKSLPNIPSQGVAESDIFYCFESSWKNFTLSELKEATNNFNEENLIGEGGYSNIYKGTLGYGQLVAIKKLRGSHEETTSDYLSELGILVHVNHPNIANVIGYGVEDGMHLVLPLSPHGSLENMLKGILVFLTQKF